MSCSQCGSPTPDPVCGDCQLMQEAEERARDWAAKDDDELEFVESDADGGGEA